SRTLQTAGMRSQAPTNVSAAKVAPPADNPVLHIRSEALPAVMYAAALSATAATRNSGSVSVSRSAMSDPRSITVRPPTNGAANPHSNDATARPLIRRGGAGGFGPITSEVVGDMCASKTDEAAPVPFASLHREQLPQHVLQDATMLIVPHLLRRVDAHDRP